MKRLFRYFKFNLVGAMGMGVQLGVLWILHRLVHGHYLFATFVAVELAVVHNFIWHRRFTWRDHSGEMAAPWVFWRFQLSNGAVSLVGNLALMWLFVQIARLPVLVANLLGIACCSLVNFWLAEVWAFAGARKDRSGRHLGLRRALPLVAILLIPGGASPAQTPPSSKGLRATDLGTDCAYENWFVGPAATSGGRLSLNTFTGGVTIGQYFARPLGRGVTYSPQFELGLVGPVPHGKDVDGLVSMDVMFANKVPGRRLYASATAGYTRMFVTGNAVNFGAGIDFGKNEYKQLFRLELRDYYLFTGPNQHVFALRFGLGRFVSD